jgi:hypothetical protein
MTNWKKCAWSDHELTELIFRRASSRRETTKDPSQHTHCFGRDSKRGPTEYEATDLSPDIPARSSLPFAPI